MIINFLQDSFNLYCYRRRGPLNIKKNVIWKQLIEEVNMKIKLVITILCTFYFFISTNVMARSTSLKGICPDPLVMQLDWQPESEHGGVYELVGNGYKIDKDKKNHIHIHI